MAPKEEIAHELSSKPIPSLPSKQSETLPTDSHTENVHDSDGPDIPKTPDGKRILTEEECYDALGFSWSWTKKWTILTVIFIAQTSMNFNTSAYSNANEALEAEFGLSAQGARVGQMVFMIAYAFGCELWAPWSEEYGRWPIMQLSLFLVNIWQIPCATAKNYGTIVICRFLGGLSSAGGSVTLGMTADMWGPDDQGYAVAYVVLSSVGGSTLGPVFGGIIAQYCSWHWIFWVMLIFGGVTQALHFFTPETRTSILIDREAQRRRKLGEEVYGPGELRESSLTIREILEIWKRPFKMFLFEPIVLFCSLLSGFSDALIFTFTESFTLVFKQWGFNGLQTGLTFIAIFIGYIIAYALYIPDVWRQQQIRQKEGNGARLPERRLLLLLFLVPLEAIGLLGFAWTSMGPEYAPWIAPLIFACLIAIANYAIYMATIDYMVAAYGPYSASATGGNGFARDFLAGIASIYATPLYENIGGKFHLSWASTLLGILAGLVAIPIYVFYWKGPVIRARSEFAQTLEADRQRHRRASHVEFVE